MGWLSWLGIAVVVLLVLGGIGLGLYGGSLSPPQHRVEQVVPDERLAH